MKGLYTNNKVDLFITPFGSHFPPCPVNRELSKSLQVQVVCEGLSNYTVSC